MRNAQYATLEKAAQDQGWVVDRCGGRHTKLIPPDKSKPIVYAPSTPGDRKGWRALLTRLRKSGLQWPA